MSPDDALGRMWPYLAALAVALAIVVSVPWLSIGSCDGRRCGTCRSAHISAAVVDNAMITTTQLQTGFAEVQLLRDSAGTGDRARAAADHGTSDDPDRAADRTDGRATGPTDGCSAQLRISYGVRTTVVVVVGVA
jgi:hypothetical protein